MKQNLIADTDERKLEQILDKQNPFKVPDGYFDDFEKKLLADIPLALTEHKQQPIRFKVIALVASAAAAIVGFIMFFNRPTAVEQNTNSRNTVADTQIHNNAEQIIEEMSDFAMLDNGDIYSYVAGE